MRAHADWMTAELHARYASYFRARGEVPPGRQHCLYVMDGDALVCAVQAYAGGPFLFCEYLTTNPELAPRRRHLGAMLLAEHIVHHAEARQLIPVAFPAHRGVVRLLRRVGFQVRPCVVMLRVPPRGE